MTVKFYPVKTPYGDISTEWCFQLLEWQGIDQISKKFLNRVEKSLAIRERLAYGYEVIGDNTHLPQLGNPFHGAC